MFNLELIASENPYSSLRKLINTLLKTTGKHFRKFVPAKERFYKMLF